MDGQQNVLHSVFNVVRIPEPLYGKRTQVRCYLLQQPMISCPIALLRTRHENGPIDFPKDRPIHGSAAIFPDQS